MINHILSIIFWLSVIAIIYTYFVYPIVLSLLTRQKKKSIKNIVNQNYTPTVSIIIPFYNEENNLPAKIQNILDLSTLPCPEDARETVLFADHPVSGAPDRSGFILPNGLLMRFKCWPKTESIIFIFQMIPSPWTRHAYSNSAV